MEPDGIPVLTAAQTRAAEQVLFDSGVPVIDLMEIAGAAVADAIGARFALMDTLILCGPGNNGGDGYVVARILREAGWPVRVAAMAEPKAEAARMARQRWGGAVENLGDAPPAPMMVDGLFGTGLTRPLDAEYSEPLNRLAKAAVHRIAIDLPSGVATDDGAVLGDVPGFDLTVALGVLKPAHHMDPGRSRCGTIELGDIGLLDIARGMVP